ncbi:UPF0149 family protein [Shewanella amazonensis]|uniref:YgfB and YecA n=1 Tax=Shewanella amazonensis (strain ATCC BAA-1098 / SB2B) TaxID=326297 RepID=A1S970_SHEAM|nr:UPF0149 family protein [Shewanella amazonensis]ABM00927.1 YgfB and YecA [Shewanella amazonensis SB2B]
MATPPSLKIEKLLGALEAAEIGQHPVEVHGAMVGLIAGGVEQGRGAWLKPLLELMNDGQSIPAELQALVEELFVDTQARLGEIDFGFMPLLPEEEEPLCDRVEALSLWVQSFLAGLAIIQPGLNQASEDVREVIADLAAVAQVEIDVVDDEESETAYVEILEFVRMAAIHCYQEFGPQDGGGAIQPSNNLH